MTTALATTPTVAALARVFLPPEAFIGWLLEDAIDEARCTALLAELAARGFDATGERYPDDYRNNDRLVFDDEGLASSLFDALRTRLPAESVHEGARWELCGLNPRFRACRYTNGQAFCIHRDGPYAPTDDLRSFLTVQLYLDDDPARTGGQTRFYADARGAIGWASIAPMRGAAIVFDHRAWHDGEAVTAGIKHVLRTDAMYRRIGDAEVGPVDPHDALGSSTIIGRHRGYAWRVIACRDGSIASAGRDGTVRRWSAPNEDASITPLVTPVALDLRLGSVTMLVEARDGRVWCGARSGRLAIIELDGTTREVAADLGAILGATTLDELVVVATSRGTLAAFDASGAHAWTRAVHDGWAWAVAPHRGELASCGHDGRVVLVDRGGHARSFAELGGPLRVIASHDEHLVAGDARGWLHELGRDGRVVRAQRVHAATVTGLARARDGAWISSSEDGTVRRTRGSESSLVIELDDFATSVAIDERGAILASGYDGAIRRLATTS